MERNQTNTCNVCFKAMRGDTLKTHMKRHERGNEDNIITKSVHDGKTEDNVVTNGQQISCTLEQLQKRVSAQMKEFDRMMELGRNLKLLVDTNGYNENGLENELKDVL